MKTKVWSMDKLHPVGDMGMYGIGSLWILDKDNKPWKHGGHKVDSVSVNPAAYYTERGI